MRACVAACMHASTHPTQAMAARRACCLGGQAPLWHPPARSFVFLPLAEGWGVPDVTLWEQFERLERKGARTLGEKSWRRVAMYMYIYRRVCVCVCVCVCGRLSLLA